MSAHQAPIERIVAEVFALQMPPINPSRRDEVIRFVTSTINGDSEIKAFLVINANLGPNKPGAIVYILTNARMIKIDIDEQNVQSTSPSIATLINVEWKSDSGRNSVKLTFQDTSTMGLAYPSTTQAITEFFQKVDLSRTKTA